jgi:hypothetical protein
VATRRCLNRKCGSWRNRRACFLVNRVPMCASCTERFIESNGIDGQSIHRISENEDDFHTTPRSTTTRMPNSSIVV